MTALTQGISRIDGKYRVLAQLGQGGTADVSLAVARGPRGFNKLVVLKSMKASLRDEAELARMFLNEARLAARLNHPNIVQTNEVFEYEGLPVIVMEYLDGQSFASVIARARGGDMLPLAMRLRIVSEALSGLHYSHELADFDGSPLKLVHRDMSPHNVFITFDGQVKILDFGIAKLAESQHHTATGVIKGKLHYMPAEQIANEGVDRRTDVYAVGVMLWEAAADRRMWPHEHDAAIMNHILNGELPRLSDVAIVESELLRIVEKALAREPKDRYATAQELQTDLDNFLSTLGTPSLRDVGKVVATLFEETRAHTKQLIETQLATVPTLSAAEYAAAKPVELAANTHSGFSAVARLDASREHPSKRAALIVAAAAALSAVVLGAWLLRPRAETAAIAPPPAPAHDPAAIRLRVTAFPAHAKLFVDDQPLANPYSQDFHGGRGKKIKIRAEASGYRAEFREFVLNGDVDIVLVLEPLAEAPISSQSPESARKPTAPVARPAKPAPPSVTDDCSIPYTLDANGVKKFKASCL